MDAVIKALTNKTVLKKIGFTLLIFFIYRVATYITIPLIDPFYIEQFFASQEGGILGLANAFTGNALRQYSIIALGIGPYITASIIIQLLQMDILPLLKEWADEGEVGKKKLNQLTRYLAIAMAFIQALAITLAFETQGGGAIFALEDPGFLEYTYVALVMTAGTAFLLFLSDQITLKGIGNGTSMIIVAGIIAGFPDMFTSLFTQYISGIDGAVTNYVDWITFAIITIVFLLIIFFVTVVNSAQRKIPIQYSNRPATAQFKGQHDSNIPMKINSAGVIPVIFAVTLLSIPSTIAGIFGGASPTWVTELFTYTRPAGYALYVLLIFVFALFYSFVQINPDKIAKNLQNQKAYIPGVRPGVETENYISRSLFKITLIGGIYLVIIASMPILMAVIFPDMPAAVSIGGTSLLIVVGVAIETTKQIKTQTMEQNYSGFIK